MFEDFDDEEFENPLPSSSIPDPALYRLIAEVEGTGYTPITARVYAPRDAEPHTRAIAEGLQDLIQDYLENQRIIENGYNVERLGGEVRKHPYATPGEVAEAGKSIPSAIQWGAVQSPFDKFWRLIVLGT